MEQPIHIVGPFPVIHHDIEYPIELGTEQIILVPNPEREIVPTFPDRMISLIIQNYYHDLKEDIVVRIEGSFKSHKRNNFKSPKWNF